MRADRPAERWIQGDVFEHIRGADLVQPKPAVGFRNFEAHEIEGGSPPQQLPRERPIVRVQTLLVGQHLVPHELRRRLTEQPLFVGELVAREEIVGIEPTRQKRRTNDLLNMGHGSLFPGERPRTPELAFGSQSGRQYKRPHMPSIQDLFTLSGRVAIVTGGSRGLSEEMAEGLAEAGVRCALAAGPPCVA